jgi:hypothetical protein
MVLAPDHASCHEWSIICTMKKLKGPTIASILSKTYHAHGSLLDVGVLVVFVHFICFEETPKNNNKKKKLEVEEEEDNRVTGVVHVFFQKRKLS